MGAAAAPQPRYGNAGGSAAPAVIELNTQGELQPLAEYHHLQPSLG